MDKRRSAAAIGPIRFFVNLLALETIFLAYFGPDVVMPLGSAAAAGIGILLIFWHRCVRFVRGASQRLMGPRAGRNEQRNNRGES
ncbi:MAG TPA: hypothetical protein VFZ25_13285 [Chloroflexota bacterium]|nr:hypothetical protein [Chloroflexota bacterium]